jgi:putative transposase
MTPKQLHRKVLRLKDYDYSQDGAYFVTVCSEKLKNLFGIIRDGEIQLVEYGKILTATWNALCQRFLNIKLDSFVVMPNHIHGILRIVGAGSPCLRNNIREPKGGETPPLQGKTSLSQIMGYFKYQTTKLINELRGTPGIKVWQRSFYEHIIRVDESFNRISDYIATNPLRWDLDRENPLARGKDEFDNWLAKFKSLPPKSPNNQE